MKHASWPWLFILCAGSPAAAAPLPQPIRAMIDAALRSDEPQTVATVVAIAKQTNPDAAAEIDAIVAGHDRAAPAPAHLATTAASSMTTPTTPTTPPRWAGEIELGGSRSTGSSDTLGLYGAAELKRLGPRWQHKLSARLDYQQTDGATTTERIVGAWQPRYTLGPTYYAFGIAQYEHDRFLGYQHRLTGGVGLGLVIASDSRLKIEVEAGPAFRFTRYRDAVPDEERLAGRGSLDLKWSPWPRITMAQQLAVYAQKGDSSVASTSSIETVLFGPLKARLSYNIQYERGAPADEKRTDTVSRATLVYGF